MTNKNDSDPRPENAAALSAPTWRTLWLASIDRQARAHGLEPEDPRVQGALRNVLASPMAEFAMLHEAASAMVAICAELRDVKRFTCHAPGIESCADCTICRFARISVNLERAVRPPSEGEQG